VSRQIDLTPAQQRILACLCAPLLTGAGPDARPASYTQIGQALGLSPNYVRNVLKALREALAGHGLPDLVGGTPERAGDDFRLPLARWAVESGLVTSDDVPDQGGRPSGGW
jgi:hypothetical protein